MSAQAEPSVAGAGAAVESPQPPQASALVSGAGEKILRLAPGQVLFREGEQSDTVYVVKKGRLLVYIETDDRVVGLADIRENETVGEMSFLDKRPRSASVKALLPSELIELRIDDFEAYVKSQPFWLQVMIETLTRRIRQANDRLIGR